VGGGGCNEGGRVGQDVTISGMQFIEKGHISKIASEVRQTDVWKGLQS
jgi:hypothetical protein